MALVAVALVNLLQQVSVVGWTVLAVGLVLLLGLGLIALGLVFMFWQRARDGSYFRGETLRQDTPALVVEE